MSTPSNETQKDRKDNHPVKIEVVIGDDKQLGHFTEPWYEDQSLATTWITSGESDTIKTNLEIVGSIMPVAETTEIPGTSTQTPGASIEIRDPNYRQLQEDQDKDCLKDLNEKIIPNNRIPKDRREDIIVDHLLHRVDTVLREVRLMRSAIHQLEHLKIVKDRSETLACGDNNNNKEQWVMSTKRPARFPIKENRRCFFCGRLGHLKANCTLWNQEIAAGAKDKKEITKVGQSRNITGTLCSSNKSGHLARDETSVKRDVRCYSCSSTEHLIKSSHSKIDPRTKRCLFCKKSNHLSVNCSHRPRK